MDLKRQKMDKKLNMAKDLKCLKISQKPKKAKLSAYLVP